MKHYFDWDQWNSQKSFLKHHITNREAESTFDDPEAKIVSDMKHSVQEERYICIGKSELGNIIYTAFTYRGTWIRVISSRPANRKEKIQYGS